MQAKTEESLPEEKTIPNSASNNPPKASTSQQNPSCPFLHALAPEIRLHIYTYLLTPGVFHLKPTTTRLLYRRHSLNPPDVDPVPGRISHAEYNVFDDIPDESDIVFEGNRQIVQDAQWCPFKRAYEVPSHGHEHDRAIISTCRTVYGEIAPALYPGITWSMCDPLPLLRLKDHILPPETFARIRHVQFSYAVYGRSPHGRGPYRFFDPEMPHYDEDEVWGSFWAVMGGLRLESLKVWVMYYSEPNDETPVITDGWVTPMVERVRGVKKVELLLKWKHGFMGLMTRSPALRLEELEEQVRAVWMSESGSEDKAERNE